MDWLGYILEGVSADSSTVFQCLASPLPKNNNS
jgi:hypothetical protein